MKEFYRKWRYLIGIVLVIIGGVLGALTGLIPFIIIVFVGVFLFASFSEEQVFCDYVIAGSTKALVRKRHYYNFIPFMLISMLLTLGKGRLLIPRAEEYFIVDIKENEDNTNTKITRKEYKVLLQEQRKIYSTQRLDKEFMRWAYTPEGIGLKRKKARLIAASIFAALSVLFILEPAGGIYLSAIYTPVFAPMAILWSRDYKDAKILQEAYERSGASTDDI